MYERIICCFGASSWTKVIAWLQIAVNTVGLILFGIGLAAIIKLGPKEFAQKIKDKETLLSSASIDSVYGIAVTVVVLSILVCIVAVVMAVFLLEGSSQHNTRYLRVWIYYSTFCLFWNVISAIFNTTDTFAVSLSRAFVTLVINIFGIWVVHVHVKEIESQSAIEATEGQRLVHRKGP